MRTALFFRVDNIDDVARTLSADDPRCAALDSVIEAELTAADPVRPRIAAAMLHLTEKTVRAWPNEGVLVAATQQPRVLLEPARLHEVFSLVWDLRRTGKTTGLLDEVSDLSTTQRCSNAKTFSAACSRWPRDRALSCAVPQTLPAPEV